MKAGQIESFLWAGVALGILYFVSRFRRDLKEGLEVAGKAYSATRTGATNIIEYFFPLVDSNSMITHAVTFPDGTRHAVPGESVNEAGYFLWKGAWYRLMVNNQGQKRAVAT